MMLSHQLHHDHNADQSLRAEPGAAELMAELAKRESPAQSNTGLVSPATDNHKKTTKRVKRAGLAGSDIKRVVVNSWPTVGDLKKTLWNLNYNFNYGFSMETY